MAIVKENTTGYATYWTSSDHTKYNTDGSVGPTVFDQGSNERVIQPIVTVSSTATRNIILVSILGGQDAGSPLGTFNPSASPTAPGLTFTHLGNGIFWAKDANPFTNKVITVYFGTWQGAFAPDGIPADPAAWASVKVEVLSGCAQEAPAYQTTAITAGNVFQITRTPALNNWLAAFGECVNTNQSAGTLVTTPTAQTNQTTFFSSTSTDASHVHTYAGPTNNASYSMGFTTPTAVSNSTFSVVEVNVYTPVPGVAEILFDGTYKLTLVLINNEPGVTLSAKLVTDPAGTPVDTGLEIILPNQSTIPYSDSMAVDLTAGTKVGLMAKISVNGTPASSSTKALFMVERLY